MSIQTNKLPDNPNIEVIKANKTGLFTNYIFKAIPLAFDESMSYYETLCGLLKYLQNTIIPTVNNNADAVAELQSLYEQLRSYVDNYFTNLDVQEEINNKLDQMVKDGTFDEILENFIPYNKDSYILAVFHDYISDQYYNPYTGGVGDGRTPRFLLSKDGKNFTEFNKEIYPLMINSPSTPNGWCGAPSIVFWNDKFIMVSSGGIKTATNDGAIGVSDDLIHWKWYDYTLGIRFQNVPVIIPAPELCILNNKLYLIESIYTGENTQDYNGNTVEVCDPYIAEVLSYDETNGFTFDTPRKLIFYENGNNSLSQNRTHIDTTITFKDGVYYALSKNDVTRSIESFRSVDLINWEMLNDSVFWRYTEAPSICYYGGTFHVYGDASQLESGSQNEMYHCVTDDFITFKDFDEVLAPRKYTTRHGSVFTITADNLKANKIIRNIPDVAIGGIGIKRPIKYLGLSTNDVVFPIQNDNLRETRYMSTCPNTIYKIIYSRDFKIDNLDNKADVSDVIIVIDKNVSKCSLTIVNSGVAGNYTQINDVYNYDSNINKSRIIHLTKDNNNVLRISEKNNEKYNLLSYFNNYGTFSDETSFVECNKNENIVNLNIRLRGLSSNTHLVSSPLPTNLRPSKTHVYPIMFRDGGYTSTTLYYGYLVINTGGAIELYSPTQWTDGTYLECALTYTI